MRSIVLVESRPSQQTGEWEAKKLPEFGAGAKLKETTRNIPREWGTLEYLTATEPLIEP